MHFHNESVRRRREILGRFGAYPIAAFVVVCHRIARSRRIRSRGCLRTVTLDDDTVDLIAKLRRERAAYGPWMFGLGPELVSPDRIGWWWSRSRKLSGIDSKWRLHDLRYWSATVAIGQGHDVRTVAGRLGHANPAMTLRVYAHAFAAADQAVATGLAGFCLTVIENLTLA